MSNAATPFFDPQVNGYAGIDFQQDNLTADQLLLATRAWQRDGGGRFFLTLVTDDWPRLLARLAHLRTVVATHPELRQTIVGWHVEGPFLSDQPGFHGAHNPAFMRDPKAEDFHLLRDAVDTDPLLVTVAPERRGVVEAIAHACSLQIAVSLGHTDASAMALSEAIDAGASGFTHLANGCPQQLDRHDNIVWRVLDLASRGNPLVVGLIADAIHVSGPLFRLIHRVVPVERLYYTTDAMAAAGSPPGRYRIGALDVEVGTDGIVRQPGRTNFAGSSLRPDQVAERARQLLGDGPADAVLPTVLHGAEAWLLRPDRA